jgi:hypothetical protein
MGRNWPTGDTDNFISLGDVTSARFLHADAWTFLCHVRIDATGDERTLVGKSLVDEADMQMRLRTSNADPAALDYRKTDNSPARYTSAAVLNHDEWYCISFSNDGTEAAGDLEVFAYNLEDYTWDIDADSGTNAADSATLTQDITLGKSGTGNFDPMDGDLAHVCYVEKVATKEEVLAYAKDPFRQVLAWRAAGVTVEFYLPLIGASTEPDWSGSGNNGTINGTIGTGDNPPVATFPAYTPHKYSVAAGSAGLDTERKRRSAVAISHYAMTPSPVPDGSFGAEDRAVIGYGYYYDFTSAVTDDLATKYVRLDHLREPMMISGG